MNGHDIITRVKNLNFPEGEYIVVSGGTLAVLGIRPTHDIDMTVTPKLHTALRATGEWKEDIRWNKVFLSKDGVDVIPEIGWEKYDMSMDFLVKTALIVEGVPFMNITEVKKFKQALGRPKDLADIELIDEYLKTHTL